MKVNYVLLYGTPYLKYELFDTFENMSKFLVNKRIANYKIYEKMEDTKEVEMIYRDNDIQVLEEENKRLNNIINELEKWLDIQITCSSTQDYGVYKMCLDKIKELKEKI